jgi:predicted house-cleaning noncanonical NTP pyrophosphatase (MazG superfamily)
MVYKLFTWKIKDKYISVFPEINVEIISWDINKEDAKNKLIEKVTEYLKTLDKMPDNRRIEELEDILEVLPENDLISVAGISFPKS